MNIHLFVKSEKPEILETLADVPRGTLRFLKTLTKQCSTSSETFRLTLLRHPEIQRLHQFLIYGFGPLKAQTNLLKIHLLNPQSDSTQEPPLIREILLAQGIILPKPLTIPQLGGIHWKQLNPVSSDAPQIAA